MSTKNMFLVTSHNRVAIRCIQVEVPDLLHSQKNKDTTDKECTRSKAPAQIAKMGQMEKE